MLRHFLRFIALVVIVFCFSCAPKTPEEFDNEKALYEYGLKLFNDKSYSDAAKFFESFKNRYPTSQLISEAEFNLAESYYKKGDYIEAVYSFQNFIYLHPTNPKVPTALYRIALSYHKQMPSTIDRDQSDTRNCINTINDLLARYPDFEEAQKAKDILTQCLRTLAKREMYIADFYLNQRSYKAALGRLETVKQDYKFKDLKQEATYKLALSYHKLHERDKAIENLNELLSMNPDNEYKNKANKLIAKLSQKKDK